MNFSHIAVTPQPVAQITKPLPFPCLKLNQYRDPLCLLYVRFSDDLYHGVAMTVFAMAAFSSFLTKSELWNTKNGSVTAYSSAIA